MNLRVTPALITSQSIQFAGRHSAALGMLQQQASSGLRVTRPSDDPSAMRVLASSRAEIGRFDARLSSIATARSRLNQSVTHLQDAQQVLVQARDLALQVRQSTDSVEPERMAAEVQQLIDRLLSIANATQDGQSLYAGAAVDATPFTSDGNAVTYHGASSRVALPVGAGLLIDVQYSGAEIFAAGRRSETIYIGPTGAAAGVGTDSGYGQAQLRVRHTSTVYAGGSGIQPGTASPGGDEIIGPPGAYTLTVDDASGTGAAGTVSLNGGPAFAYTNGDANLEVMGPRGEKIYVDTTAMTAGFSGTVDMTANGALSVDGGLTEQPLLFGGDQTLVNSRTGAVTHVDTAGIRRAGTDRIEYGGTAGVFGALIALRDEMKNVDNLDPQAWQAAMGRRLDDLENRHNGLLEVVAEQAVSLQQLDQVEARTQNIQLDLQQLVSDHEAADIADVVLRLQETQALLQLTLATSARMFDQSLLNFMR